MAAKSGRGVVGDIGCGGNKYTGPPLGRSIQPLVGYLCGTDGLGVPAVHERILGAAAGRSYGIEFSVGNRTLVLGTMGFGCHGRAVIGFPLPS